MKKLLLFSCLFFIFLPTILFAKGSFVAEVQVVTDSAYRVEDEQGEQYTIDRDIVIASINDIETGDRVIVETLNEENEEYIISNLWRMPWVVVLLILFILGILILNRKHGFKSIINLFVTFIFIFLFIIPLILKGYSPIIVSVTGALLALSWSIYFTHGINKKSHSATLSIFLSLIFAVILSWVAVKFASLTGFSNEGSVFLVQLGYDHVHMRGLLFAAIIIGTLGVIDDIILNQVSVVEEFLLENPNMSPKKVLSSTLKIGYDHTSSMINTLVLAYVGASFPLVILLKIGEPPFDTITNILNNETIATEIARTLVGTLTLLIAMPISSYIAVKLLTKK
jgi:uncharacterized membrane protein